MGHLQAGAREPQKAFQHYQQRVWRDVDGLPQNTVLCITQSPEGYLWLGTMGGVARFDGVHFTAFDGSNTPELKSDVIDGIIPEPDGSVWIGTEGGLSRRGADGRFTGFTTTEGLTGSLSTRLVQDTSGHLWIGRSGGGLFRWRDGHCEALTIGHGPAADEIHSMINDGEGGLWLGTKAGLARLKDGRFILYTTEQGLPCGFIRALCRDHEGNLWIGTMGGGLTRFRDGAFTRFGASEGLPSDQVWALLEDREGNLWVGTGGAGVYRIRDGEVTSFSSANGLPGDRVCSLFQSAEGDVWIGTDGGLCRLRDRRFRVYTEADGLVNDFSMGVYQDHTGALWAGSTEGVARFRDGATTAFTTAQGLPLGEITAIGEDTAGDVWIGAANGLNRWLGESFVPQALGPGPLAPAIACIFSNRAGEFLVGTRGAGTWVRRGDGWEAFSLPAEWTRTQVMVFYEDRAGNLWAGTSDGGVGRRTGGKWQVWTTRDGVAADYVISFFEDSNGAMWAGTLGGGLSRWKDGRWKTISARDGLFDNIVYQILPDEAGNLWMGCNRGIYRVPLKELNDFADGRISSIKSYSYGLADGLLSRECNSPRPAGWKTRDGRLIFPTTKGLVAIEPNTRPLEPPRVLIEETRLDRQATPRGETIRIRPGQSELVIQYTALHWHRPEASQFQYQLLGLDRNWTDAGTRRTAYYSHLPPGAYTFRVRADNGNGVWSTQNAVVAIIVSPPFWRTWWFVSLSAAALGGLILLGFGLRVRQLKGRQVAQENFSRRLLEAHESERRRIAAELHDSLGQSLAMIKNSAVFGAQSAGDSKAAQAQFERITVQSAHAIGEVRDISYDLRPYMLDQFGLAKAIKSLLDKIADASPLRVKAEIDDVSGLLPADVEMSIYRIVQESLNNILKHADATEVDVTMKKTESSVKLEIRDNGKGFDPRISENAERRGFGLLGISERVRLLGGTQTIRSATGAGTTLTVKLELNKTGPTNV